MLWTLPLRPCIHPARARSPRPARGRAPGTRRVSGSGRLICSADHVGPAGHVKARVAGLPWASQRFVLPGEAHRTGERRDVRGRGAGDSAGARFKLGQGGAELLGGRPRLRLQPGDGPLAAQPRLPVDRGRALCSNGDPPAPAGQERPNGPHAGSLGSCDGCRKPDDWGFPCTAVGIFGLWSDLPAWTEIPLLLPRRTTVLVDGAPIVSPSALASE